VATEDIGRVVKFALLRRLSIHDLHNVVAHKVASPGDDPNYRCVVRVGYRCVFTIEQQPMGWVRHLSVSVLGDGVAPNEMAVAMLAEAFGFKFAAPLSQDAKLGEPVSLQFLQVNNAVDAIKSLDNVYSEELGGGKIAVNLMQRFTE
jgi:hypothetical protein